MTSLRGTGPVPSDLRPGPTRAIDTVVTNVQLDDVLWERLCRALGARHIIRLAPGDDQGLRRGLELADVALISAMPPIEDLRGPNLKWLHVTHSGLDQVARQEFLDRGLIVSGSAGYSVETLAEHAFFFMLSLAYRSAALLDAQRARRWEKASRADLRSLYGRTAGIIGLGHIGQAIATRCAAFGMNVTGHRRADQPVAGVSRLYASERGEGIGPLLEQSDFVILALPLTDQSRGLIDGAALARMKPSAFLINVARGGIVDEEALIAALRDGRIAGAGLDVFAREPLPPESPLWQMPDVLVTPHSSPAEPDREARAVAIIAENAERYRQGLPLLNQLSGAEVLGP